MRQWIRRTDKMILCHLVYPQLVIGISSLIVSMRKAIMTVVLLTNSEVEDCAAAVQRMVRRLQGSLMKQKKSAVHAKLVSWKDAQVAKLIDKLNQKEAQIDQWQKNTSVHCI